MFNIFFLVLDIM